MSGNPVRHSNVKKTLARQLIARSAQSIEAYRNEQGNGGYIGGGSDPDQRAAVVYLGEDAEVIAKRVHALLSPARSTLMPSDPLLTFVAEAPAKEDHIYRFTYAGHCVIRNVAKRWAEQEIWRESGTDDATQARMARRIEIERLKRAFDAALRRIGSPFPGTEVAAKEARAALQLPEGRLSD